MKLDGATIPIRARSLALCLDLAVAFYRAHFRPILALALRFAVPCVAVACLLAWVTEIGFFLGLVLFFVVSPALGALLVAGVGPRVFGEPFTVKRALAFFRARSGRVLAALLWPRVFLALGGLLCYAMGTGALVLYLAIPVLLLGRAFPAAEVELLEQLSGARRRERLSALREGAAMELLGRWLGVLVFFAAGVAVGFVLVDRTAETLLGVELLLSRAESLLDPLLPGLSAQPRVVAVLQALLWLVYPLARLALFFCYLDVRIRKECWDLELDFRIEAARLERRRG
ncbi:MAG: hypothetical protein JXQ29_01380 [Planctomycetes bacterium]|nr:hypothetical protein [Planctomycetota bacterium]